MSKSKDEERELRKAEFELLNDMFDDLPNGAYFAAMAEHGFEPDDIIELADDDE